MQVKLRKGVNGMTNKDREKYSDQARSEMAKKVRDGYNKKTLADHPANVNAIGTFKKQWEKKLEDKLAFIERREKSNYYDGKPGDYKKDWEDAFYARFIIYLNEDAWKEYLK